MINSKCFSFIALFAFSLSPVAIAVAQQSGNAESEEVEKILVKARKRDESIIEVPLSVKAFTQQDLQNSGLTELETLAQFAPNLDFQNMGNSQPGRFNPGIRFRGMDVAISTPTNQTGGFFVDGVAVLGGESSVSFSDVAQVEVLRGPQPVYFGRGTFGGAINYTTVTPSDELGGEISLAYSPTFGSNDFHAYVEGALSDDVSARLTVFNREQGAPFTANDGGDLGAETTTGVSLIISASLSDDLTIKSRLAYSQDDDGAPSATFVPFSSYSNISAGDTLDVKLSDGTSGATWTIPWLSGNVPYTEVSSNAKFYDITVADGQYVYGTALEGGTYNVGDLLAARPESGDTPSLNHIGLRSDLVSFSTELSYFINDELSFDALVGYNTKDTTQIRDGDYTDAETWILHSYLELESYSAEARLSYDNGDDLRIMGGINYSQLDQMGDVDGGYSVFDGIFGVLQNGYGGALLDATTIDTLGVFGSVEYDLSDMVTLVAEARYQDDTIDNRSGTTQDTLSDSTELQFTGLLPRLAIIVSPDENTNIYASYSEALLPGAYNSFFDSMDADDAAEFLTQNPNIVIKTKEEEIASYEIGFKQSALDGDLWYSIVGFHQEWEGMKSTGLYSFVASSGNFYTLNPTFTGSSTQTGIETEGRWSLTDNIGLQFAYGYTKSVYDNYDSNNFRSPLGLDYGQFVKADGKTLPRSPKHSGAVGLSYENEMTADWRYMVRADATYRGKTYTDELNLTTIKAYSLLNLRAKFMNSEDLAVELYCTNCLDKEGWATGRRLVDFSVKPNYFSTQGVLVDPITPREIGVRVTYAF